MNPDPSPPGKRAETKVNRQTGTSEAVYGFASSAPGSITLATPATFVLGVLGFFKGIVWPAMLVYEALKVLHMWPPVHPVRKTVEYQNLKNPFEGFFRIVGLAAVGWDTLFATAPPSPRVRSRPRISAASARLVLPVISRTMLMALILSPERASARILPMFGSCGIMAGACAWAASGISMVLWQYEHFMLVCPCGGSSVAPHIGHFRVRTSSDILASLRHC